MGNSNDRPDRTSQPDNGDENGSEENATNQ